MSHRDDKEYHQLTDLAATGPHNIRSALMHDVDRKLVTHVIDFINTKLGSVEFLRNERRAAAESPDRDNWTISFSFPLSHGGIPQAADINEIRNIMFNAGWGGCGVTIDLGSNKFQVALTHEKSVLFG